MFLRARPDQPLAFFRDANGHCFIFLRIKRPNHRSRRNQRNFMLAGSSAEQNSNSQFLLGIHFHSTPETIKKGS